MMKSAPMKKVLSGMPPSHKGAMMVSGREKGVRKGKTLSQSVSKRKVR